MTDTGKGTRLYSQQSAKTTIRRDDKGKPIETKTIQRSNTFSKTLPAKPREMRKEVKKYSINTNLRNAPKRPAPKQPAPKKLPPKHPAPKTAKSTIKTITTKTTTTRTTSTKSVQVKKVTRTQSSRKSGKNH